MQTYIAMLRGINVSGHKIIKMAALRTALTNLGLSNVQTYIQSGNVIFDHALTDQQSLEILIHKQILAHWGFEVPVIVKSTEEIKNVAKNNPYLPEKSDETEKLCVTFLSAAPEQQLVENIQNEDYGDDSFVIVEKHVYQHCAAGFGRTKLVNNFFERKLKVKVTGRNWNTVNKLVELAEASQS